VLDDATLRDPLPGSTLDTKQIDQGADPELIIELLYAPLYYRLLLHQGELHTVDELRTLVEHVLRSVARSA